MSINTLNENIFKNNKSYYVLVEEDSVGLLGFITDPSYRTNSSNSCLEYEVTHNITQAYPIYEGDPLLEAADQLAPYLSLYKVNQTYEFEYVDTAILKGD